MCKTVKTTLTTLETYVWSPLVQSQTDRNSDDLETLTVAQSVRKCLAYDGTVTVLQTVRAPAVRTLKHINTLHTLPPYFFKTHLHTSLPSTSTSSQLSLSFSCPQQNPVHFRSTNRHSCSSNHPPSDHPGERSEPQNLVAPQSSVCKTCSDTCSARHSFKQKAPL